MINEIKEALEKATPGPWKGKHALTPYITVEEGVVDEIIATVPSRSNLKLLSNAPTYIRYLLDELEKTQEEIERLKAVMK